MDVSLTVFEINAFRSKIACFPHPTLARRPLAEERPAIST